ncbi:probable tRNA (uracil-O(2)-)-methyltransferase isoform X2 [Hippopotamus amphibius kiboko]|uniref:probable tRNA (uracil-O(2)-)-methyltransferase isoform X2 n=1 Tax=Hippopotamus amphibius kiboko TaxID=575201 RepID=UPI002592366E|nr:probable tRNA (uracil-O(2)-)-methyltransferase isoform X2 [Hippopotamus amphibius kiboko]
MAEVGRASVRDPDSLLPRGFWAAVAVWVERPQVANKRLCGVRLEARRSASLPWAEHSGPRRNAGAEPEERAPAGGGPEEGPDPGQRSLEGGPGPRQSAGPTQGPQECRGRGRQGEDQQGASVAAPLASRAPEQPGKAGAGEGDFPASDLDAFWDDFSRSLASGDREMLAFLTRSWAGSQSEASHELDVSLRTVIPKTNQHCPLSSPRREIVVQDVLHGAVTFLPLEEDDEGYLKVKRSNVYQIQLSHSGGGWFISVLIFCPERWHSDGIVYPKPTWLGEELLAKLARWCVESRQSGFKSTLSLISIMKYSKVYQALKEKYKDMVKVWPEVTNPEKFVYEDVAIATYLLILWEEERAERGETAKQSFVDLGCGNGLLVHILSSEGHPGRGIDVRRRKIWDMYGPQTHLEESAITPNDKTLFPDVDWLIGNHSDELTPWIPVMAARSSYDCRFFVLPCCFFDFVGKYQRRQSNKTQYRVYLDFITEVGSACGFHVEEDCLRIPSTKRVCLIGKSRTYPPAGEDSVDEQRTRYMNGRRGSPASPPGQRPAPPPAGATAGGADGPQGRGALDSGARPTPESPAEGPWLSGFHPREKAERVRNCAALPRDLVDRVVLQVANLLLGGEHVHTQGSQSGSVKAWNRGGSLSLAEVAGQLDRETLQRLRRECGGLQTLLRNRPQVFRVLNGRVRIRDWREERLQEEKEAEAKRKLFSETFKTRICWFFAHHPDGCALPSDCCPFAHGPGELRPAPTTK